MSAHLAFRRDGLVATALGKAEAWLLEPSDSTGRARAEEVRLRPVVAVVGLAKGSGATTVSRALAVELAARDPAGASAVSSVNGSGGIPLGSHSANRLARKLADVPAERIRTAGRLCLVESENHTALAASLRRLAPLVLDVGHGPSAAGPTSVADHLVVVAAPESEPALAAVVAESLSRLGPRRLLVVNRVGDEPGEWDGRNALFFLDSRAGSRLALAGRDARRSLGPGIVELADRCEEART